MDAVEKIIEEERQLYDYDGPDKVISSATMRRQIEAEPIPDVMISSGIPALDDAVNQFSGGELVALSGPTKHGKTLLAQTMTVSMADEGESVLWFTYEVKAKQFFKQFGEKVPLFYLPQVLKDTSLEWIEKRIHEAKLKTNCKAVFIDHLHFLVPFNSNNISLVIGGVCRRLKQIALEHNLVIFLIAHLCKTKLETEIDIDAIRDSSFISQESDTVLLIWRRNQRENGAVVKVARCRETGVMNKKIYLVKEGNFLREDIYEHE